MRIALRSPREFVLAWFFLALAACGGGGGGSPRPIPPSATLTYPSGAQIFVLNAAITAVTPTITGTLNSFSVSPALPSGLALNSSTGVISGTPTAITAATNYTVSATAPDGASASASVSITVNDAPPSQVSYGSTSFTYTAGHASTTLSPKTAGVTVVSWSINPALPAGLSFDTTNGSISGTPIAASASASYVVTARNSGGPGTVTLTIAVSSAPVIHLGHQYAIIQTRVTATNVLSLDSQSNWILWDYSGHSVIASGNGGCPQFGDGCVFSASVGVDLAGTTAAIVTATGFELHSTTDGHTLGTIATSSANWWKLATDGSYLAAGNSTGVSAWSSSGTLLFSNAGDYSKGGAFATPSQLLIGGGGAGANVIETITVPSGASTTGPSFNGTFSSWFIDGGQFITVSGSTALIYTRAAAQEGAITSVTSGAQVVGQGNWVWTFPKTGAVLNIYPATNSSTTPAATYAFSRLSQATGSGTTIGVASEQSPSVSGTVSVIDLSGATPVKTDYTSSLNPAESATAAASPYAAVSASQWVLGAAPGVVIDGPTLATTPTYFGIGAITSIAAGTSYFAIATSSGNILFFDSSTLAQVGQIAFSASELQMSADGTVLAAIGGEAVSTSNPVQIYTLPAGTLTYTWPYTGGPSGTNAIDVALSGNGSVLGQVLWNPSLYSYTEEASAPTGGTPLFSSTFSFTDAESDQFASAPPVRISPDGTLIAYSEGGEPGGSTSYTFSSPGTNLLLNGSLVTAFSGLTVGWLDNSRLLVSNYTGSGGSEAGLQYAGCTLYGPSGTPTGAPCAIGTALPRFQPVTTDGIYAPQTNQILSVSTGAVTWASGDPVVNGGAVAGANVIFVSGIDLLAQTF